VKAGALKRGERGFHVPFPRANSALYKERPKFFPDVPYGLKACRCISRPDCFVRYVALVPTFEPTDDAEEDIELDSKRDSDSDFGGRQR